MNAIIKINTHRTSALIMSRVRSLISKSLSSPIQPGFIVSHSAIRITPAPRISKDYASYGDTQFELFFIHTFSLIDADFPRHFLSSFIKPGYLCKNFTQYTTESSIFFHTFKLSFFIIIINNSYTIPCPCYSNVKLRPCFGF